MPFRTKPTSLVASDPDRYLKRRGRRWHYVRRVPKHAEAHDQRGTIQVSLKTTSQEVARLKRDALEKADDLYWSGVADGMAAETAFERYDAARTRAQALGFDYLTAERIASTLPVEEIVRRIEAAGQPGPGDAEATLGGVEEPSLKVREAMEFYLETMAVDEARGMSPHQLTQRFKVKRHAAEDFIEVVGNKPVLEITRADAQRYYKYWLARIDGKGGQKKVSANFANRNFGNMRKLFRTYANWLALDAKNPFEGLSFSSRKMEKGIVPPFDPDWLRDRILRPGSFGKLNREAHLIFLALIETGCRPSEICNLTAENIRLDDEVPHIAIRFRADRQIKTEASVREIPLLGVSLAALRQAPNGFERYRDKETALSAALMKSLKVNDLLPTPQHGVYSVRHAFEKRMQEAGLDYDLRCRLMGHANSRPKYGDGGSLSWRRDQLAKITLPFDSDVLLC
ncbi:tyrosine-type recombinase/integrase [Parvularcula sp. ZS-1/3]|uniref:Tyrosine-type recombinase/integrase n=1 Tax=Parvularcula mediterranea TaxID=2732508 RepID=A0A7Y3RN24_9PROT|nr:tyrosine-type recombinase/integrase [Parvularcula mediterranea]NNU17088.1 tyrosine-type recombinase/integrase [Parvularcula mediterranea]